MHLMQHLAAIELNTDGLQKFLKTDGINVGVLVIGLVILFSAKQRDWAGSMSRVGIALIGVVVMGLAGVSFALGTGLSGLFISKS